MNAISLYQVSKKSKKHSFKNLPKGVIEVKESILRFANRRNRFAQLNFLPSSNRLAKGRKIFQTNLHQILYV